MPIGPSYNYGPNPGQSSSGDPRGRVQNANQYAQQRYEQQQGPLANYAAYNYGRGTESDYNNYNNIMGNYLDMAGTPRYNAAPQGGVGGGAAPAYNPADPQSVDAYIAYMQKQPGVNPSVINDPGYWRQKMLADPNTGGGLGPDANYVREKMMKQEGGGGGGGGGTGASYGYFQNFAGGGNDISMDPMALGAVGSALGGYGEFAKTGGYSDADIANMRARGVSPIRSAYANAQQELSRNRSLQGGYSPNMAASLVKMARERGQASADATQNVEAGIAEARNRGRQFGISGQASTGLGLGNLQADIGAGNMSRRLAGAQGMQSGEAIGGQLGFNYAQLAQQGRLGALEGARSLYGSTPGQAQLFGNQALGFTGQGATAGQGYVNNEVNAGNQTGKFDQTYGRVGQVVNDAGNIGLSFLDQYNRAKGKNRYAEPAPTSTYHRDF